MTEKVKDDKPMPEQPATVDTEIKALEKELAAATAKGDYATVAKIAKQIDKLKSSGKSSAEKQRLAELEKIAAEIATAVKPLLDKYMDKIGQLNGDGVFITADGATVEVKCVKGKRSSSGAPAQKLPITTAELLKKYGNEKFDDTMTYQQAWDSNTNGNFRYYQIRIPLARKDGYDV